MDDGIYVPLSDETLKKLDELVSLTGLTEDELVGMLLYKFLRELRQYENDNFPDDDHADDCGIRTRGMCDCTNLPAAALPPEALSLSSCSGEGEPAGL
jgi:hypothetical protein